MMVLMQAPIGLELYLHNFFSFPKSEKKKMAGGAPLPIPTADFLNWSYGTQTEGLKKLQRDLKELKKLTSPKRHLGYQKEFNQHIHGIRQTRKDLIQAAKGLSNKESDVMIDDTMRDTLENKFEAINNEGVRREEVITERLEKRLGRELQKERRKARRPVRRYEKDFEKKKKTKYN